MKTISVYLLFALVAMPLAACFANARAQSEPQFASTVPNPPPAPIPTLRSAVVIVLDDVGEDDLEEVSALGGTPNLDALAQQGVTFRAAYANASCSPTRRSLFFGRYWTRDSGVMCDPPDPILSPTSAEISLAELMPVNATSALFGKWHVGPSPVGAPWQCAPQGHDFDLWLAGTVSGCGLAGYDRWERVDYCASDISTEYEPIALSDSFVTTWPSLAEPKLGVVAMQLAHGPFHQPGRRLLPPGWPTHAISDEAKYRSMIACADTMVGRALEAIRTSDPDLSETMVIVVGDNGSPLVPKGKTTTFERGIHVPLLIVGGPVANGGRETAELVHIVDLYATVATWAGSGIRTETDGFSLIPILQQTTHAPIRETVICGSIPDSCVRSNKLKLRHVDVAGDPENPVEQLYDLSVDPQEEASVLGDPAYAAEESALRAELDAFLARP